MFFVYLYSIPVTVDWNHKWTVSIGSIACGHFHPYTLLWLLWLYKQKDPPVTLLYPWSVYRDQLIILSFVDNSINYNRNFQLKTCCRNTGDCKCKGKHQHVKSCCIWVKGMHRIVIPINEKDVVLGYPSVVHTEYPAKKQSDISNYILWM
jgi:hypothetical protein